LVTSAGRNLGGQRSADELREMVRLQVEAKKKNTWHAAEFLNIIY